jgi:hypothetical protein
MGDHNFVFGAVKESVRCQKCSGQVPYRGRGRHPKFCAACKGDVYRHRHNTMCRLCRRGYLTYPSWHLRRGVGANNNWCVAGKVMCKRCYKLLTGRAKTIVIPDRCPWVCRVHKSGRTIIQLRSNASKMIYRYRLMMECKLGRPLDWSEVVHHIDGDHTNDSIDNLAITTASDHVKNHIAELRASGKEWPGIKAMRDGLAALRTERQCKVCGITFPTYKLDTCRRCTIRAKARERYARRRAAQ